MLEAAEAAGTAGAGTIIGLGLGAACLVIGRKRVAAWVVGLGARLNQTPDHGEKGKLGAILKGLVEKNGHARVERAIGIWFGKNDRSDYGIELFKIKLNGGNSELRPRPAAGGGNEQDRRNMATLRAMGRSR